jgi:hypothetical protein
MLSFLSAVFKIVIMATSNCVNLGLALVKTKPSALFYRIGTEGLITVV